MRHRKSRYRLNRFTSWRKATLVSLARSLFIYQSIKTTKTRAKAVRPLIEKIIGLGLEGSLSAKRRVYKILGDHKLVSRIFNDIAGRFKNKNGGYVRILGLGKRRGDDADLALLELTEIKKPQKKEALAHKEKAAKPHEEKAQGPAAPSVEEKKHKPEAVLHEKPPISKKPAKKFLGGIRNIFKKKSDSL